MSTSLKHLAFFAMPLFLLLIGLSPLLFAATSSPQSTNSPISPTGQMPSFPSASTQPGPSIIATGSIEISSYPTNAIVWYETPEKKVRAGQTPLRLGLIPGNYKLTMALEGYPEYVREVVIAPEKAGSFFVDFTILPRPLATPFPKPSPIPLSTDYECEFDKLQDRVACRISFSDRVLQGKPLYIPEECRDLANSSRGECVSNYAKFRVCSAKSSAIDRDDCQRRILGIGNLDSEKLKCDKKKVEGERLACNEGLRARVYLLVKSRLYDLEENAIRLMRLGAGEGPTIEFISSLEGKITEFNSAGGLEQRKKVIWDVILLWGQYRRDAKAQLDKLALSKKK